MVMTCAMQEAVGSFVVPDKASCAYKQESLDITKVSEVTPKTVEKTFI